MTFEALKLALDRSFPGFTGACKAALRTLGRMFITLREKDFSDITSDFILVGQAVKYANICGIVVIISPTERGNAGETSVEKVQDVLPESYRPFLEETSG